VTTRRFPIGAITDEFSPADFVLSLNEMAEIGMTEVELRVINGRNIVDLTNDEVDRVRAEVEARGMHVLSIASPVLKCVLPDAPPVDARFQQDMFGSKHTIADQDRLSTRAFEIAERTGATVVRVFSYWRTIDPPQCFDRIVAALRGLAEGAASRGLTIGLENEAACNIATGAETARVMQALDHPNLAIVWDPANAMVAGESPFPFGYGTLPVSRIVHVHVKDCHVNDHKPTWGPVGEMGIDWRGQLQALARDGYHGAINLETHWQGPGGSNKLEASRICGRNLRALVAAVQPLS
jgi:sugar phosphate isomerase/epimerase